MRGCRLHHHQGEAAQREVDASVLAPAMCPVSFRSDLLSYMALHRSMAATRALCFEQEHVSVRSPPTSGMRSSERSS